MTMNLDRIVLSHGAHASPDEGTCLMEVVSMLAGEPFGDAPSCVSPVLAVFGARLNDALLPGRMDLEPRLRALAPSLIGTANRPEDDQRWGLMAADWLIRVYLPTWLRLAGLQAEATALAEGPEIAAWGALPQAQIGAARDAANAAWAAARDSAWAAARDSANAAWAAARAAAWDATWDSAWAAARDSAWAAAWDAARATAGDAAWAAAGAAVTDATWAAAGAAARAAAWDAALSATWAAARAGARTAAGDAAWAAAGAAVTDATWAAAGAAVTDATWAAARDAARAAARDAEALPPAVGQLQDSALVLFERMVMPT